MVGVKYKNLCSAAYYGDLKMMKKLVEGEEEEAGEEKEEEWRGRVGVEGMVETWAGVRRREFGVGFDVECIKGDVFGHVFKPSGGGGVVASPLHWAVVGDEPEAVLYLLRKGAKLSTVATPFRATPMTISETNNLPHVHQIFTSNEAKILLEIEALHESLSADLEKITCNVLATSKTDVFHPPGRFETLGEAFFNETRSETTKENVQPAVKFIPDSEYTVPSLPGTQLNPVTDVLKAAGETTVGDLVMLLTKIERRCGGGHNDKVEVLVGGVLEGDLKGMLGVEGDVGDVLTAGLGVEAVVEQCSKQVEGNVYVTWKEIDDEVKEAWGSLKEGDKGVFPTILACTTQPPPPDDFAITVTAPTAFTPIHPPFYPTAPSTFIPAHTHFEVTSTAPLTLTTSPPTRPSLVLDTASLSQALSEIQIYQEKLTELRRLKNDHKNAMKEEKKEPEDAGDPEEAEEGNEGEEGEEGA